jgi:type VI secretion system protein VasJ
VLGSIESANSWHWAAWGKHPVARDYFCVGATAQLVKAFSDWIEKGYKILSSRRSPSTRLHSWRFWARGPRRDALICGVGRDSSDSLGRPYPLLIMGTGPLEGWKDQWDLLPFACEKTWGQMEHLSTRRFTDFREFEDGVHVIKPPHPSWTGFISRKESMEVAASLSDNRASCWEPAGLENEVASLSQKADLFVSLDSEPFGDPQTLAGLWHSFLKARISEVPNAVFMGGAPEETHLAVFRRALVPTDFVRLWSRQDVGGAPSTSNGV